MKRKEQLKPHLMKCVVAGSVIALAGAIYTSLMFKSGLLNLPGYIIWHIVSLLCGGGAGFVGGVLIALIPVRLPSAASYLVGALGGAFGFYLQMYFFLIYMFKNSPTSF